MVQEYDVFKKYLTKGISVIKGCEKFCSAEWLDSFLKNSKSYECPDMISELDNDVVIFEHFQFDGSNKTKKGMRGIQEENKIEAEINDFYNKGEDGSFSTITREKESEVNYWNNFMYVFQKHYNKIDSYKHNLDDISTDNKTITTGFCIENQYPPYARSMIQNGEKVFFQEVVLIELLEFLDLFEKSDDLDFIILCGIFNHENMAIYVNKKMIPYLRERSYSIKDISFWNANEMVFSSLMEIKPKD